MQSIKTAVSIRKALFEQAEAAAREMKVSRSRLFTLALEEYLDRQTNQELLARINAAYADEPDQSERSLRSKSRRSHRRMVQGQW